MQVCWAIPAGWGWTASLYSTGSTQGDLLCKENKGNETIEAEGRIRITFTNRAAGKTLHTMFPKKSAANKSLKLVPSCRKLRFSSSVLGNE